jgi:hypothetical protein
VIVSKQVNYLKNNWNFNKTIEFPTLSVFDILLEQTTINVVSLMEFQTKYGLV